MKRKFTAGPWAVNPFVAQVDAFGSDGRPLAVCQLLWPTDERSEAETEANGHLIAAAPDLYDALKACVGLIEGAIASKRPDADDVELVPGGSYMLSDARAAIAKAEGLHS
jgi:hypothetical protein